MKRFGRRNRSFFRLNAMDGRSPRDGRVIEELGWYDPNSKDPDKQLSLKMERIEYWLSVGAQPSDTVRQLIERQKRNGVAEAVVAEPASPEAVAPEGVAPEAVAPEATPPQAAAPESAAPQAPALEQAAPQAPTAEQGEGQ
ncbi:MAG: 30S ribosomal protein S16 [Planctomycetes bacterium]|nr:30S ribosomal protein S16 [Planctomycetota bacterium]